MQPTLGVCKYIIVISRCECNNQDIVRAYPGYNWLLSHKLRQPGTIWDGSWRFFLMPVISPVFNIDHGTINFTVNVWPGNVSVDASCSEASYEKLLGVKLEDLYSITVQCCLLKIHIWVITR